MCLSFRYSDFDWLRREIQKSVQIYIPELPGKALAKQLTLPVGKGKKEGIFDEAFIEERRQGEPKVTKFSTLKSVNLMPPSGLEDFINNLAGHPLVQNEKALHLFLQEKDLNKEQYVPGKVRR